ncbi:nuclear envelope pore membrane protein POM 121 [Tiliqua scincoides]|uniref:nuclear envelope pore membrane protein POM 121 n=1 Tax=Tiliqua scincoides TaxID=71010 RepID=UPI003462F053
MSRGGPAGGGAWWAPLRRAAGEGGAGPPEGGRALALLAAAAAALLLLWLLLGPGGAALSLAAGAACGWRWAGGARRAPRRQQQQQPLRPRRDAAPCAKRTAAEGAANGGLRAGGPRCCPGRNSLALPPHFVLPPRRRYPIHQAQYGSLGTLPSICWDGYQRKNRLSTRHSNAVQSPVTVKIARPDSNIGRSPLLEQLSYPVSFSATLDNTLDPCAKEAVLSALKESRKRAMMEEEEEEENHPQGLPSGQESKRRRHGSGGSGQFLLEPLVANGVAASVVPKLGSLKRSLLSHGLDDVSSKRSRTSSISSVNSLCVGGIPSSIRNAIASSYSSSQGLAELWKRTGQSTSPLSSPASSRSQTPERPSKKARSLESSLVEEKVPQASGASTPAKADKEVQEEEAAETPVSRHSSLELCSSPGSSRKRKRRIQLLATRRPDHLFALPPPPQLGYSATSEDLDADKQVTLQRFNKVLEEKATADSAPEPPVETSSAPSALSFPLRPAQPLPVLTVVTAAVGTNPLLESLKKMQGEQSCSVQAAAVTEAAQSLTPAASLDLTTVPPATTPEAKPITLGVPVSLVAAAPSPAVTEPTSGVATASSSEPGQTPARPPSAPRPSVLEMLVSPPTSQPAAVAASAAPSPMPVLKPLFGSLAKSDGLAFSSSSSSSSTPVSAASSPAPAPGVVPTLGLPCGAPGSTFKPIFGAPPAPSTTVAPLAVATTTAAASFFTFKQSPQPAPAHRMPGSHPTSCASGFPGLLEAVVAAPGSSSAVTSITPASVSKPVFSFGLAMPAAPGGSTTAAAAAATTAAASAAQPFLFGSLPSTTTSGTAASAPIFQFGKAAAATATEPALSLGASPAFSQGPTSSTPGPAATTAAAATSFSIFGSGVPACLAPAATTQQPAPLTFGSCSTAFSAAFGTPSKPPPPYSAGASQLTVDVGAPEGRQAASKPGPGGPPSFGAHFSFAGSALQPSTQPAFGSTAQAPLGGSGLLASFGPKSTGQPAFGATTSVFSFGTATTSAAVPSFGANTQTTSSSGTGGSVFGGSAPSSFPFGAASQPATAAAGSAFGLGAATGGVSAGGPTGGFGFGSGQSGAAGAAPPFGSSLAQQPPLGSQNQGTPFAFSTTPEGKPAFGGAPTPTFGQGLPAPGGGTAGSSLSFGASIAPAFGGAATTFGPTTPAFSIGAGSKVGSRQRLQARRHNTRKK